MSNERNEIEKIKNVLDHSAGHIALILLNAENTMYYEGLITLVNDTFRELKKKITQKW